MTLQELYQKICGDYERARKIMMMDAIIAKMIVKYPADKSCAALAAAAEKPDPAAMFESAHALNGVSANLGLMEIYNRCCVLSDEFREGNPRTMTDEEVREKVQEVVRLDQQARDAIREFAG